MSKMKITVVSESELEQWDEELQELVVYFPSKFYIVNSLGQHVFYHCRNRQDAQNAADEEYGKNKYVVRQAKQSAGSGNYTCKGTSTRRGQKK